MLFFFLAQAAGTLKAQTYQPMAVDSTLWLNYLRHAVNTISFDTAYFFVAGDTTANGKDWKKFTYWSDEMIPELKGLIRDDTTNQEVWIKMIPPFTLDTTEILLYDFGLNVGDTVWLPGWDLDTLLSFNCCDPTTLHPLWYTDQYITWVPPAHGIITNFDSVITLDGVWRRRIWFQASGQSLNIVEGIGSTLFSPLYKFAKNFSSTFDVLLGCKVKIDKGNRYPIYRQLCPITPGQCTQIPFGNQYLCDGLVNFEEKLNPSAEIEVYPNPNDGSFKVKHGYGFNELQIYDVQGNSMFYQKISGTETSVKLKLSTGTYTLRLSGRLGEMFHKIIIQ